MADEIVGRGVRVAEGGEEGRGDGGRLLLVVAGGGGDVGVGFCVCGYGGGREERDAVDGAEGAGEAGVGGREVGEEESGGGGGGGG